MFEHVFSHRYATYDIAVFNTILGEILMNKQRMVKTTAKDGERERVREGINVELDGKNFIMR